MGKNERRAVAHETQVADKSVRQRIRSSQPESVYFLQTFKIQFINPISEHTLACDLVPYFSTASMHVVLDMSSLPSSPAP